MTLRCVGGCCFFNYKYFVPEYRGARSNSQEKIKSRAERFGGFQSDDAKKAARAAKFGEMLGKQVFLFDGEHCEFFEIPAGGREDNQCWH